MPGPPKRVSASAKKRQKSAQAKRKRAESVRIGKQIDEWNAIRLDNGFIKDEQVAELLISRYNEFGERKRKRVQAQTASESSSVAGSIKEMSMSGIEAMSSESDIGTFAVPLTSTPKEVPKSNIHVPSVARPTVMSRTEAKRSQSMKPQETSIRILFDDDEEENLDAGAIDDDDDPEYIPSEWDVSMNVEPPDGLIVDVDIDEAVHDIGFEDEEEPSTVDPPSQGVTKLNRVTPAHEEEPMFMVSVASLNVLTELVPYTVCKNPECKERTTIKRRIEGCGVKIRWECRNGHTSYSWASQAVLPNGVMMGNFKMASSILLSGNNYAKVALLFKFMRVGLPSKSSFNTIQSNYVVPVVDRFWQNIKMSSQEEHRASQVVIAGDGRMDSPGHTANFCTYTMMNQADKTILAMEVVDKREVQLKSGRMEAKGFERAMTDLQGTGLNITEVVTDAHTQIAYIMKNQFPESRHSWDMWHGAKNFGKKLCAAASEKGNELLKPWVSDITNHFFYSAEHCNGNTLLLKDKLFSVMQHCINNHKWGLGACDHEPISEDEVRTKQWLHPRGPEMAALRKVITNQRFTNTLHHYVTCQTTSELESFNNHLLMYVSKRQAFSFPVYRCRSYLAAIDYMYHLDRPVRKRKKGENYYSRQYSKAAGHWAFKYVKEPKTYNYIGEIVIDVLNTYCAHHRDQPLSSKVVRTADDPRRIARTIAPSSPPQTRGIVWETRSRLKKHTVQPTIGKCVVLDCRSE